MSKLNLNAVDRFLDSVDILLGNTVDPRVVALNNILDRVFGPDLGGWPSKEDMHAAGFHSYPVATDVVWARNQLFDAIQEAYPHLFPDPQHDTSIWDEMPARSGRLGELDEIIMNLNETGAEISRERSAYETEAEWQAALHVVGDELNSAYEELNRLEAEDVLEMERLNREANSGISQLTTPQ